MVLLYRHGFAAFAKHLWDSRFKRCLVLISIFEYLAKKLTCLTDGIYCIILYHIYVKFTLILIVDFSGDFLKNPLSSYKQGVDLVLLLCLNHKKKHEGYYLRNSDKEECSSCCSSSQNDWMIKSVSRLCVYNSQY